MEFAQLGRTDMSVSRIGFGAWAIGGSWGPVNDAESLAALHAAVDAGVNFIDTADVYGDGHSERLVARLKQERRHEQIFVATKAGRRLPAQLIEGYTRDNLSSWVERSLTNLAVDAIDLLQLHCPPSSLFDTTEVFGYLDDLVDAGKVRHYGVSVETVDEARRAIRHQNVKSVQIIFNIFRQKPAEDFFNEASSKQVAILARVPLASGLLTGKLTEQSQFAATDHRLFNREGQQFDRGETFSGVPYRLGLEAVELLRPLVPSGITLTQFALRWVLMWKSVTCTIPGARTPAQAHENARAADLPRLAPDIMSAIAAIYEQHVKPHVHAHW
jgi:aryl-alcohol dehydrogenase-like predicted oxidoreductase